jgi:hypothetical protein
MLSGLLVFLVGVLVLAVVVYVCHLVIDMLSLPANVKQIALIVIGLIGLVVLVILAIQAWGGGIYIVPSHPVRVP